MSRNPNWQKRLTCFAALYACLFSVVSFASALSPEEKEMRVQLKRQVFGGLMFQRAEQVTAGQAEPLMSFTARDSLFVNWVIPRRNVDGFEAALNLPEGFHLAPIQILEGERPRHFLSLNIYEVTIGAPALRAEWSVYVTVGNDPTPRFMVIEAVSSADWFDPVTGPQPAMPLRYARGAGELEAVIAAPETQFEVRFIEPCRNFSNTRFATHDWAVANDRIYWTNGIFDKAYYDSSLAGTGLTLVDPREVEIVDGSRWAQFVRPRPEHVLLFDAPIEFALSPWANLADPSLGLEPAHRAMLSGVKSSVFGQLAQFSAYQAYTGADEALVEFQVDKSVPAYFVNFRVPYDKVHALADAIGLPPGFHLAPMSALAHQDPEFMLSLNVYKASGVAAGMRAEWSVYVTSDEDPYNAYFMVIDVATDTPSFDVVRLATPAAQVFSHAVDAAGVARTAIVNGADSFDLAFRVPGPRARDRQINFDWVRANEKIYWTNGVYDRVLYNETLLDAQIVIVDPKSVTIADRTRWAAFVDRKPLEVLMFRNALELKLNPWFNMEEIEAVLP